MTSLTPESGVQISLLDHLINDDLHINHQLTQPLRPQIYHTTKKVISSPDKYRQGSAKILPGRKDFWILFSKKVKKESFFKFFFPKREKRFFFRILFSKNRKKNLFSKSFFEKSKKEYFLKFFFPKKEKRLFFQKSFFKKYWEKKKITGKSFFNII